MNTVSQPAATRSIDSSKWILLNSMGQSPERLSGPEGKKKKKKKKKSTAAPLPRRGNGAIVDTLFPANLQLSSECGCHDNLLLPVLAAGSPSLTAWRWLA